MGRDVPNRALCFFSGLAFTDPKIIQHMRFKAAEVVTAAPDVKHSHEAAGQSVTACAGGHRTGGMCGDIVHVVTFQDL